MRLACRFSPKKLKAEGDSLGLCSGVRQYSTGNAFLKTIRCGGLSGRAAEGTDAQAYLFAERTISSAKYGFLMNSSIMPSFTPWSIASSASLK